MIKRYLISLTLLLSSTPAWAATANYEGTIRNVVTSGATNFAFRVSLEPAMSGCIGNFAYINTDDQNYQAKVATLLTAYALGKAVTLTISYIENQGLQRCKLVDTIVGE